MFIWLIFVSFFGAVLALILKFFAGFLESVFFCSSCSCQSNAATAGAASVDHSTESAVDDGVLP